MKIEILGTGCAKCKTLYENTRAAVQEKGIEAIGHCLLMLFAGTFTGFVEGFVKARGVVNFSLWAKRVSGLFVALVGGWFVWQGV
jgi:hypothetical protein